MQQENPRAVVAAKMMFKTAFGGCACLLTTGNKRGLRVLWYRSFTKGEDSDKIRLLLVETATLGTAAERIKGFLQWFHCVWSVKVGFGGFWFF